MATAVVCRGHERSVQDIDFSPNGEVLASASNDGTVRLFERSTGRQRRVFTEHRKPVYCVGFAPLGTTCASGGDSDSVLIWDYVTGVIERRLQHSAPVFALVWSHNGLRLATSSEDTTVQVFDTTTGATVFVLTACTDVTYSLAFSANDDMLVSGSDDSVVRVWSMTTGTQTATLNGHRNLVRFVAFTDGDSRVTSADMANQVRVWDIATQQQTRQFPIEQDGYVWTASMSCDGSCIAAVNTVAAVHSIHFHDVASGKDLGGIAESFTELWCVGFSPDGQWIAAGGDDRVVTIWPTPDIVKLEIASNLASS